MFEQFFPLVLLMLVGAIISIAMVTLSWVLGPKKVTPYKQSPYECGVTPIGSAKERFPIKFYLVAILFVLFDIEVVFLWSWLTVFRHAPTDFKIFTGIVVGVYMLLWILGDIYVLKAGAIEWDEGTTLAEEKLQDAPFISQTTPQLSAGSEPA